MNELAQKMEEQVAGLEFLDRAGRSIGRLTMTVSLTPEELERIRKVLRGIGDLSMEAVDKLSALFDEREQTRRKLTWDNVAAHLITSFRPPDARVEPPLDFESACAIATDKKHHVAAYVDGFDLPTLRAGFPYPKPPKYFYCGQCFHEMVHP